VQYADYAAWQRRRLSGPLLERQLAYWRARLGGALPVLELPPGAARPARRTFHGAQRAFPLPPALAEAAGALGRGAGCTLFMTLFAAFCVLLRDLSGQDDLLIGTPIAGRARVETEGLIGPFINTLVLRADLSGAPRFTEVLRRVREVALGAFAHQDVPFERLVAELNPERRPGHTPLFQVAFGLHNAPQGEMDLPGLALSSLPGAGVLVRYDLTIWVTEGASGLRLWWTYRTDLFSPEAIVSLAGRLEAVLERAAATPEARIDALDLRTAEERQDEERRGAAVKAGNLERFRQLSRAKDRSGRA
jgi:non-ribosomal peptide synthetase component F